VHQSTYLRNMRFSQVECITLGGGEKHDVDGEGDLLLYSTDTRQQMLLTSVLYVQTFSYKLCSGVQLTSRCDNAAYQQQGTVVEITYSDIPFLCGDMVKNLYTLNCIFVLPAEGQIHVSLAMWYVRLGHPSVPMVKHMSRYGNVKNMGEVHKQKVFRCDVCATAKLKKASTLNQQSSGAA
jgi:hypothetical protein